MKIMQVMRMAAKSGATVTLGLATGGPSPSGTAPPDATAHPVYLRNLAMVVTTELATADPTFWGCPSMYRVIIEKLT